MHGPKPNKADQRRFDQMQERGCVPCYLEARLVGRDWQPEPGDIHHVTQGDHQQTYCNCPWHHRGVPKNDLPTRDMEAAFGPSMAREPARYRARYGTEEDLLAFQEAMLLKSPQQLQEQK